VITQLAAARSIALAAWESSGMFKTVWIQRMCNKHSQLHAIAKTQFEKFLQGRFEKFGRFAAERFVAFFRPPA
jgi:hypothetical protein